MATGGRMCQPLAMMKLPARPVAASVAAPPTAVAIDDGPGVLHVTRTEGTGGYRLVRHDGDALWTIRDGQDRTVTWITDPERQDLVEGGRVALRWCRVEQGGLFSPAIADETVRVPARIRSECGDSRSGRVSAVTIHFEAAGLAEGQSHTVEALLISGSGGADTVARLRDGGLPLRRGPDGDGTWTLLLDLEETRPDWSERRLIWQLLYAPRRNGFAFEISSRQEGGPRGEAPMPWPRRLGPGKLPIEVRQPKPGLGCLAPGTGVGGGDAGDGKDFAALRLLAPSPGPDGVWRYQHSEMLESDKAADAETHADRLCGSFHLHDDSGVPMVRDDWTAVHTEGTKHSKFRHVSEAQRIEATITVGYRQSIEYGHRVALDLGGGRQAVAVLAPPSGAAGGARPRLWSGAGRRLIDLPEGDAAWDRLGDDVLLPAHVAVLPEPEDVTRDRAADSAAPFAALDAARAAESNAPLPGIASNRTQMRVYDAASDIARDTLSLRVEDSKRRFHTGRADKLPGSRKPVAVDMEEFLWARIGSAFEDIAAQADEPIERSDLQVIVTHPGYLDGGRHDQLVAGLEHIRSQMLDPQASDIPLSSICALPEPLCILSDLRASGDLARLLEAAGADAARAQAGPAMVIDVGHQTIDVGVERRPSPGGGAPGPIQWLHSSAVDMGGSELDAALAAALHDALLEDLRARGAADAGAVHALRQSFALDEATLDALRPEAGEGAADPAAIAARARIFDARARIEEAKRAWPEDEADPFAIALGTRGDPPIAWFPDAPALPQLQAPSAAALLARPPLRDFLGDLDAYLSGLPWPAPSVCVLTGRGAAFGPLRRTVEARVGEINRSRDDGEKVLLLFDDSHPVRRKLRVALGAVDLAGCLGHASFEGFEVASALFFRDEVPIHCAPIEAAARSRLEVPDGATHVTVLRANAAVGRRLVEMRREPGEATTPEAAEAAFFAHARRFFVNDALGRRQPVEGGTAYEVSRRRDEGLSLLIRRGERVELTRGDSVRSWMLPYFDPLPSGEPG
jgi:hypothetical protein